MTSDHLLPILENERDSEMFGARCWRHPCRCTRRIAIGEDDRPDRGVRGITMDDIIRRLAARLIAKQIARQAQEATALISTHSVRRLRASAWRTSSRH